MRLDDLVRLSMFVLLASSVLVRAQVAHLTAIPSGVAAKAGFYFPNHIHLSTRRPANLKSLPNGMKEPLFATLWLQGKPFHLVVGERTLYVDSTGTGHLAKAPWKLDHGTYGATVPFRIRLAGKAVMASVILYRFDSSDKSKAKMRDELFFHADYGVGGTVNLDGQTYKVIFDDDWCKGDFANAKPPAMTPPAILMLIDSGGKGHYDTSIGQDAFDSFYVNFKKFKLSYLAPDGSYAKFEEVKDQP